ncbi:MAG: hypothetical protein AB7Q17_17425 [Phycisphaerae bacterium]
MPRSMKFRATVIGCFALLPLALGGCPVLSELVQFPDFDPPDNLVRDQFDASLNNRPPVAAAGDDVVVKPGDLVVLDAALSTDPDRNALLFIWQQVEGEPLVTLDQMFSSISSFDAPADVSGEVTLMFRVTVVDGFASATDDVRVTIRPE